MNLAVRFFAIALEINRQGRRMTKREPTVSMQITTSGMKYLAFNHLG